jgi:Arylsulfotransferase (ASST)
VTGALVKGSHRLTLGLLCLLGVGSVGAYLAVGRRSPGGSSAETAPATVTGPVPASGSWYELPAGSQDARPDAEEQLQDLAALGYLAGYEAAPADSGVIFWDQERAYPGYNLVVSGDAPEALLSDMRGRVLHSWRHEAPDSYHVQPERDFWRRARLLDDGSLLAIFDPYGMIKLDRDSNLVWATDGSTRIHHDLAVTGDGSIYTLGKRLGKLPRIDDRLTFGQDLILVLDPAGSIRREVSILEAFENSPFAADIEASLRVSAGDAPGDVWEDFHANTIGVLDGSLETLSPVFKAGNVVSCSPAHDNVFIIDPEVPTVVWNWFGPWRRIHEPKILPGGKLLLFHNNGYRPVAPVWSQALEYDLLSRQPTWVYEGDSQDLGTRFFSGTSSTVDRLPNGNTLIVVTESGRAIEVDAEGKRVWEFRNPKRAGERQQLIASLFQLQRLPRDRVDRWLGASTSRDAAGRAGSR